MVGAGVFGSGIVTESGRFLDPSYWAKTVCDKIKAANVVQVLLQSCFIVKTPDENLRVIGRLS
jgi:hypothetical protein